MARVEWIEDEEVKGLNREMLKKIKGLPVDRLRKALIERDRGMYERGFMVGVDECSISILSILHDEFGWGNTRIQRLLERAADRMAAAKIEGVNCKDLKDTMVEEGVSALNNLILTCEDEEEKQDEKDSNDIAD